MNLKFLKYLPFLFCGFLLSSCTEDILEPDLVVDNYEEGDLDDVYSLNFMVTLDDMGSSSTRAFDPTAEAPELAKWENYIDPERFRVLFFDDSNRFLFESKNRWLKQVDVNDSYSSWYVSIPLGAFGNDSYGDGKEYDWEAIHEYLTDPNHTFKIAILANRPADLQYPGFTDSSLSLPNGIFKNDGPVWGPDDVGKRTLMDLHHCQYDIIYADKGNHWDNTTNNYGNSYYDFVMGDINTQRPTMGASIHWVSFDNGDTDKELIYQKNATASTSDTYARNVKMPSADHPIPMYGIQRFNHIPKSEWRKGTPFDLSNVPSNAYPDANYKPNTISLLRSCVRLDFCFPKSLGEPKVITLWYSNIYSRTEPMDTWTPTNELWKPHNAGCEWEDIRDYGLICNNKSPGNGNSKADYQKRLSWFYGVWGDKSVWGNDAWKFTTRTSGNVTVATGPAYPHIFNTCIQRNKVIRLQKADVTRYYNDNNYHYAIYTGERNMNDPNTLPNMTKNPYIACFIVSWDKKKYYCIPLLNYNVTQPQSVTSLFGPQTEDMYTSGSWPSAVNTYCNNLVNETNKDYWPYPLVRNHIYRFTLKGTKAGDGDLDFGIKSEVLKSDDIDFKDKAKNLNVKSLSPEFKVTPDSRLIVK